MGLYALWQTHKPVILAVGAALLVIGVLWAVGLIYVKGEKAGAGAVTSAVQADTIRKTEEARKQKERANEAVRDKPLDAVIDGLR